MPIASARHVPSDILLVSFITLIHGFHLIRDLNTDNVDFLLSRAINNERAMENY